MKLIKLYFVLERFNVITEYMRTWEMVDVYRTIKSANEALDKIKLRYPNDRFRIEIKELE
ncbi:hypothetical protein UFOVP245_19 [uncultured Caudovirales phage]|uniref:Uncharacterized protein n=1 Tax=uncultured Caudovirales phage TaxID=2100421 RepID=A0A6J7WRT8_9CAUD|nr:hypothetical protein UFOVP245_19 [uncultured Caudovirales phage]